jgi:phosphate transport system substrate-binding protein
VNKFGFLLILLITSVFTGCAGKNDTGTGATAQKLSGAVKVDGSSTVYPITEAVAEEFIKENPRVQVTVGISGTGGGFKKFCLGETDINDASRPIKDKEKNVCTENNIGWTELKVAFDGLSVLVNPQNDFADYLTIEELNKIWAPDSTVKYWNDVRAGWPHEELVLFGPDTDSGTFDYFTDVINGDEGVSRADYTASADDNVLVQGIAGEKYSMGYFGYAYYVENKDKLKVIPIDGGNGPVTPSQETILKGDYAPLSRPLFIYVNKKSLTKPEVKAFVEYYLTQGDELIEEVGYVRVDDATRSENLNEIG